MGIFKPAEPHSPVCLLNITPTFPWSRAIVHCAVSAYSSTVLKMDTLEFLYMHLKSVLIIEEDILMLWTSTILDTVWAREL